MERTYFNSTVLDSMTKFDPKNHNAYIWGPPGTGKTCIATAVMTKINGPMLRARSITRIVQKGFNDDELSEIDLILLFCGEKISTRSYYQPGIFAMAIDDIAVEKMSEHATTTLTEILDRRAEAGINGLIVTSNLSLDHLANRIGSDRITSRLAGMCKVFSLIGEKDYRIGVLSETRTAKG